MVYLKFSKLVGSKNKDIHSYICTSLFFILLNTILSLLPISFSRSIFKIEMNEMYNKDTKNHAINRFQHHILSLRFYIVHSIIRNQTEG